MIITTEFVSESETQCAALGMPGLAPVIVAHPLSSCTDDEIRQRANQAAGQVKRLLLAL